MLTPAFTAAQTGHPVFGKLKARSHSLFTAINLFSVRHTFADKTQQFVITCFQTNVKTIKARFPDISGPKSEDICYATSNRQEAVKRIAPDCDLVLVIGAPNSSNSQRLVEVAERAGTSARLIQRASEIVPEWLDTVSTLGLTAGASAPEALVREVISRLCELREVGEEETVSARETITFKLPRQLTV